MEATNLVEVELQAEDATLAQKIAFIMEVQSKYEGILLTQAESMTRLLSIVEKLAGHTERILDIIEAANVRLDQDDERFGSIEKVIDRLVGNSDRYSTDIRTLIDSHRAADERVQNLVSAMGRFIGQHSS